MIKNLINYNNTTTFYVINLFTIKDYMSLAILQIENILYSISFLQQIIKTQVKGVRLPRAI